MTEKQNGFNPSHLLPMGLFRWGEHSDTTITAKGPNGENIDLEVNPVTHADGVGTLFVPAQGQSEKLKVLFPPPKNGNPMYGNK